MASRNEPTDANGPDDGVLQVWTAEDPSVVWENESTWRLELSFSLAPSSTLGVFLDGRLAADPVSECLSQSSKEPSDTRFWVFQTSEEPLQWTAVPAAPDELQPAALVPAPGTVISGSEYNQARLLALRVEISFPVAVVPEVEKFLWLWRLEDSQQVAKVPVTSGSELSTEQRGLPGNVVGLPPQPVV